MDVYKRTLILLEKLLSNVGDQYWLKYIQDDIALWDKDKTVEHHLNAYRKDGINEGPICIVNGHHITKENEPWATQLRDHLCHILIQTARNFLEFHEINIGLDEITANKLTHWKLKGYFLYQYASFSTICRKCGFIHCNGYQLDYILAQYVMPNLVKNYFDRGIEDSLLNFKQIKSEKAVTDIRNSIISEIKMMNYNFSEDKGFMRPCYRCGAQDTAVKYLKIDFNDEGARIIGED